MSKVKTGTRPKATTAEAKNDLPALAKRREVITQIYRHPVVIVAGETGCGKSTQIPQFILDDAAKSGVVARVLVTQPRRVAATTLAQRVARERDEDLGQSVGHHVRLNCLSPDYAKHPATVSFVTLRMVFQYMIRDGDLSNVTHLVLDEVHDRDVFLEVLLGMLKEKMDSEGGLKFKLVLMSATINTRELSAYFRDCPVVEIKSRQFPIHDFYLEDILEATDFKIITKRREKPERITNAADFSVVHGNNARMFQENPNEYKVGTLTGIYNPSSEKIDYNLIKKLLYHIDKRYPAPTNDKKNHGILIFLPGVGEVEKMCKCLYRSGSSRYHVAVLYSMMSSKDQDEALRQTPGDNRRRVIIATNIAETSITVPGLRFVIDCGKAKVSGYEPDNDLEVLNLEWISRANVRQRRGRVGRIQPGICFHLYSKGRMETFEEFAVPEIKRNRLDELVLALTNIGFHGKIRQLLLERMSAKPEKLSVDNAFRNLKLYGLMEADEQLSSMGNVAAVLGLDPRLAKLALLGALNKCLFPALAIASCLSNNDVMLPAFEDEDVKDKEAARSTLADGSNSDHFMMVRVMRNHLKIDKRNKRAIDEHIYAWLNTGVLAASAEVMMDLARKLYKIGLIKTQSPVDEAANTKMLNESWVRAILKLAFAPNAGLGLFQAGVKGQPSSLVVSKKGRASAEGRVINVNNASEKCDGREVIYWRRMRDTKGKVLIYDTTVMQAKDAREAQWSKSNVQKNSRRA